MLEQHVRKATVADADYLCRRLRAADREECLAATGAYPEVFLPLLLSQTNNIQTLLDPEGKPFGLCGHKPIATHRDIGVVWMMSTDDIHRFPKKFMTLSRQWIEETNAKYNVIGNYVDERNTVHVKWLKHVGFHIIKREPKWGAAGIPFLHFVRINK